VTEKPISEALGSTPEETNQLINLINSGVKLKRVYVDRNVSARHKFFTKQNKEKLEFIYEPLDEASIHFCSVCFAKAEHKESMTKDKDYARYLCTRCRDKTTRESKPKTSRIKNYVRIAGHSRMYPSLTIEQVEAMYKAYQAAQEANKDVNETGNVGGEPGNTVEGASSPQNPDGEPN